MPIPCYGRFESKHAKNEVPKLDFKGMANNAHANWNVVRKV